MPVKIDIPTLAIATAPRRDSVQWNNGTITWEQFCSWLDTPADRKEAGNYLFGRLANKRRSNSTIISRSALALDADNARPDLMETAEMLLPWALAMHTTYSSTLEHPKYRIIIPVDRELLPDEYRYAVEKVMALLGEDQFDPTCKEPARYMFRPATQDRSHYDRRVVDGPPASADELLQGFDTDLSDREVPKHIGQNKQDPLTVPGAVGAFNRAYSIHDAIVTFELPYDPVSLGRWSLRGTASVAGLNEIGNNLCYSHHATDPAYGRACSAFDLVRLHRFGYMDEDCKPGTPPHKRPSHSAMLKFAAEDEKVIRELNLDTHTGAQQDFQAADDPDDEPNPQPDNWRLHLRRSPRNARLLDSMDNWNLIVEHDPVMNCLRHNDMSEELEVTADLPWRPLDMGALFTGQDRQALLSYIELTYDIKITLQRLDQILVQARFRQHYHPVKEYLLSLKWDGTKRVETCLPGVEPTTYSRMVARKSLVAAVARIMEPGCKWDHTLVLYGKEGLGKTYWIDRMARGYSASLGDITAKDTLLTMQRSWIMISDEGYSLRKGDSEALKEFLTRTHDTFRRPYAAEAQRTPRHCVIWGATNEEIFLRRQEGNRRFLIVHCQAKADFSKYTDEYVDQLWAEALALYTDGEPLYLNEGEERLATAKREFFTEEDGLPGQLQEYLNQRVPEDWFEMSQAERRSYQAMRGGLESPDDGLPITEVCARQLWFEALQEQHQPRLTDLAAIGKAMRQMPGWQHVGYASIPPYGQQTVYRRTLANPESGALD